MLLIVIKFLKLFMKFFQQIEVHSLMNKAKRFYLVQLVQTVNKSLKSFMMRRLKCMKSRKIAMQGKNLSQSMTRNSRSRRPWQKLED